jgi:hypothetical protein
LEEDGGDKIVEVLRPWAEKEYERGDYAKAIKELAAGLYFIKLFSKDFNQTLPLIKN